GRAADGGVDRRRRQRAPRHRHRRDRRDAVRHLPGPAADPGVLRRGAQDAWRPDGRAAGAEAGVIAVAHRYAEGWTPVGTRPEVSLPASRCAGGAGTPGPVAPFPAPPGRHHFSRPGRRLKKTAAEAAGSVGAKGGSRRRDIGPGEVRPGWRRQRTVVGRPLDAVDVYWPSWIAYSAAPRCGGCRGACSSNAAWRDCSAAVKGESSRSAALKAPPDQDTRTGSPPLNDSVRRSASAMAASSSPACRKIPVATVSPCAAASATSGESPAISP